MKLCDFSEITLRQQDDGLDLYAGSDESLVLVSQSFYPRSFLHPVRPLDGKGVLTEDSPSHHPWQHGIYCGLHHVGDSDFWFDHGQRPQAGRIEHVGCEVLGENAWSVQSRWLAHDDQRTLLHETQDWSWHPVQGVDSGRGDTWRLELSWTLVAQDSFTIQAYDYGGPFIRMPFVDNEERCGARAINAKGDTGPACDKQDADWLAIAMSIEGRDKPAGFLMSYHPDTPSSRRWRLDGQYGMGPVVVSKPLVCERGWSRTWRYGITCLPQGLDHDLGALHGALSIKRIHWINKTENIYWSK